MKPKFKFQEWLSSSVADQGQHYAWFVCKIDGIDRLVLALVGQTYV